MAIVPSTKYPAQTLTSDPGGYPYGKARNVVSAGDGSGTPWEEALVNDIWGFLQALLMGAGATPSGNPDKVGASQYLDAIPKILEGEDLHWTGAHVFDDAATLSAGAVLGAELTYATPQARVLIVPLDQLQPAQAPPLAGDTAWRLQWGLLSGGLYWLGNPIVAGDLLSGVVKLPKGSTVTKVDAFIENESGQSLQMRVWAMHHDLTTRDPTHTVVGASPTVSTAVSQIITTGAVSIAMDQHDLLQVTFSPGTGGPNSASVYWVAVYFNEAAATGHG